MDACRIERVLQHVTDPALVLTESRRCLRHGGQIGVFEPDWASLSFGASDSAVSTAVVESVVERHRHGAIGGRLGHLLVDAGFDEVAVQPETVAWTSLDGIRRSFRFDEDVARAEATIGSREGVRRWLTELTQLEKAAHLNVQITRYYATGIAP